jgi:hypothetical protein
LPEEDIRKVNEQFFNFQQIKNDLKSVNNFWLVIYDFEELLVV